MREFYPGQLVHWVPAGASLVTPRLVPAMVIEYSAKRVHIRIITPEGPGIDKYVIPKQLVCREYDPKLDGASYEEIERYAARKYITKK